jgi:hypothetical protein
MLRIARSYLVWCALILIAVAGVCVQPDAAMAQAEAKKADKADKAAAKPRASLRGEYAIMAKELGLGGDQLAAYTKAVEGRDAAVKAWEQGNAEQLAALRKAAEDAKAKGDKEAAKQASAQLKAINAERDKAVDDHRTIIFATLNSEQLVKWQGFGLYRSAMARYKRVGLSDEQTQRVREMCYAASQSKGLVGNGDKKSLAALRDEVGGKVESDVLTAEQRAKLNEKPAKTDKAAAK